jgi:hypothetical protein
MSSGQDLYMAAVAMQGEGVTPHEVAVRLVERAREQGIICIVHRDSPPKLELIVDGAEQVIEFDGASWRTTRP